MKNFSFYHLEAMASKYLKVSHHNQMKLCGGWFSFGGKYYFTQSELVDILGSSSEIPNEYERSFGVTDHNDSFTNIELTNFYVLTQQQFDDLMAGPIGSEFDKSEHSFPSASSDPSSGSSSSSYGGGTSGSPAVLSDENEKKANALVEALYSCILSYIPVERRTVTMKNKLKREIRNGVYSAFFSSCYIDNIGTFFYSYHFSDNIILIRFYTQDLSYDKAYEIEMTSY